MRLRGTPFGFFFDNFDHATYFLSFMAIKKGSMSNYQDFQSPQIASQHKENSKLSLSNVSMSQRNPLLTHGRVLINLIDLESFIMKNKLVSEMEEFRGGKERQF